MIMKTAKIDVYRPWGTYHGYCVDLYYRNKLLFSVMGQFENIMDSIEHAKQWARNQGFTNFKFIDYRKHLIK